MRLKLIATLSIKFRLNNRFMSQQENIPTIAQLEQEYHFIKDSSLDEVPGVIVFDSGLPGPCVGITIMTHGNEPSGLACLLHFRKENNLQKRLKQGKVMIILNNLAGAEKYFAAKKLNDTEAIRKARYVDINMNRLPADLSQQSKIYEVIRSNQLLPLWKMFDFGMDIHSTTQKSDPMVISVGSLMPELFKGFPIENIISNIENVQIGKPAAAFYGNDLKKIPIIVIETGSHDDSASFVRAIDCVNKFLFNIGLVDAIDAETPPKMCKLYHVQASLMVPNTSYSLARVFITYDFVKKGEVLAEGDKGSILMPFDGHALMGPKDQKIHDIVEEVLFLTLPVKEIIC